jgi:hypothetical protein
LRTANGADASETFAEVELEQVRRSRIGRRRSSAKEFYGGAYVDRSVVNLASLVLLFELRGKRILLTGDGRGDHIIEGLSVAGLLDAGCMHVDVLHVPHYGSKNNVTTEFFRTVTADHYIFSGTGQYGNPSVETLKMLTRAREGERFAMHFISRDGESNMGTRLDAFFFEEDQTPRVYRRVFRSPGSKSHFINMLDRVRY